MAQSDENLDKNSLKNKHLVSFFRELFHVWQLSEHNFFVIYYKQIWVVFVW